MLAQADAIPIIHDAIVLRPGGRQCKPAVGKPRKTPYYHAVLLLTERTCHDLLSSFDCLSRSSSGRNAGHLPHLRLGWRPGRRPADQVGQRPTWKVGTASARITPDSPLWMAGYAGRDRPAEGKLHDLWVKVLILEAPNGRRAVMITNDVCGFSRQLRGHLCRPESSQPP